MKKIVIVAKNQETHFIKRMLEEAGQENCAFFDPWKDYIIPEGQNYLVRTTGIHHSDLDLMMLGTLKDKNIVNPLASLKLFRSKLTQYEWMENHFFPVLPFINLKNADLIQVERFFRLYPELIVKPHCGQGGWGIEVLTWEKFKTWWKKKKGVDESYLLQPYKKHAIEYRYFFIKGQGDFVLKRMSTRGVAANFKNQGEAQVSTMPMALLAKLQELADHSGLLYGAIDVLVEGEHLSILDVNSVPGFEQLEAVTGENIAQKLVNASFFCQSF